MAATVDFRAGRAIAPWTPAAALAGYTLWLLSVPMAGFLSRYQAEDALLFFLVPHTLGLLLAPRWLGPRFPAASRIAGLATMGLSLLLCLTGAWPRTVLVCLGVAAAPLVVRVGTVVSTSPHRERAVVAGLAAANLALAVLLRAAAPAELNVALVVAALALPVWANAPDPATFAAASPAGPRRLIEYMPFVFLFHLLSGLYYGGLFPAYEAVAIAPGSELLLYIAGVVLAAPLARRGFDRVLVAAVLASVISLALLRLQQPAAVNGSMFAMQLSAGFMDSFLLLFLLSQPDPARCFSWGMGVMCLGILGGKLLTVLQGAAVGVVVAGGNAALTVAVLALYVFRRHAAGRDPALAMALAGSSPQAEVRDSPLAKLSRPELRYVVSPALRARLSDMELSALDMVLEGKTFNEVAQSLGVSASTVKTYMQRTYEKAGVGNRKALLAKLARSD